MLIKLLISSGLAIVFSTLPPICEIKISLISDVTDKFTPFILSEVTDKLLLKLMCEFNTDVWLMLDVAEYSAPPIILADVAEYSLARISV